jgi:hypothetical protein
MLQVGATGIEEQEEDINYVHTEKIGRFSVVLAKLVLPLTTFLLVSHSHWAKGL